MVDNKPDYRKRLSDILLKHRKIVQFEAWVPESFYRISEIKNKDERLKALQYLKKDAESEIREIAILSGFCQPISGNFESNELEWYDFDSLPCLPPKDKQKTKNAVDSINRLKEYIKPINEDIVILILQKKAVEKPRSINAQFKELFKDPLNADKTIILLESAGYLDEKGNWLGRTGLKGEIQCIYQVLKDNGLLKNGKVTTQVRLFYKRLNYKVGINERSFRNEINDPDTIKRLDKLLKALTRQ